jgi:hypothetical protein
VYPSNGGHPKQCEFGLHWRLAKRIIIFAKKQCKLGMCCNNAAHTAKSTLNGDNLMQATRKSAPADTEGRETKKQVTLLLVNICPDTRETTVNGKTYWVRKASVRNNNGDAKPIEVWGTEKQWQWFDGETVNAEFASSPKTGGYRWYFSPVTKAPVYLEEDEFENG